jgi:hypothetical protein
MELNISNPPNLHSPLSLVYIEDTRIAPCTEEASALMNLSVDYPNNTLDLAIGRIGPLNSQLQYTDPILLFPQ